MDVDVQIVDRIYEAALVPAAWPEVLDRLCRLVGGWGGALTAIDPRRTVRYSATPRYEPAYEAFSRHGGQHRNLRTERFITRRETGFITDLELCSEEELLVDPLYNDFLRPHGLAWTVGTLVPTPSADLVIFDLCRRDADGPFTRETAAALDAYRPHLARAALLSARLNLQRCEVAVEILGRIGLPAAIVRSTGGVIALNPAFEELAPDISIGARDRLVLSDPAADALFRQAFETTGRNAPGSVLSIPVPVHDQGPALVLHLVPARRRAADLFAQAAFLLVVTPVAAPTAPLTEMLYGLFDLTPAEARLARALAGGVSTANFASSSGLSRETIKKQLQGVFAKTGTRRQAELVRLLAGAAPIGNAKDDDGADRARMS